MKISVCNALRRVDRKALKQGMRLYSFKYELSARPTTSAKKDHIDQHLDHEDTEICSGSNMRYSLNQSRSTAIDNKASLSGDAPTVKKQSIKAAIEEQNLQPAMLPAYFQKSMETDSLVTLESEGSEKDKVSQNSMRRFQVSKTCANATLPLKSVKLASPFPEPVKMMMSRTISDEEKAMQMLADARSQRQFAEQQARSASSLASRNLHTATRRWYSKVVGKVDMIEKIKATALDCNKNISTQFKNSGGNRGKSEEVKKSVGVEEKAKKKAAKEVFLMM